MFLEQKINILEWSALDYKCALEKNVPCLMISEGSCDTEDWTNDAENATLTSQE